MLLSLLSLLFTSSMKKDDDSQSSATKKAEPDFGLSGKLAAETNTLNASYGIIS